LVYVLNAVQAKLSGGSEYIPYVLEFPDNPVIFFYREQPFTYATHCPKKAGLCIHCHVFFRFLPAFTQGMQMFNFHGNRLDEIIRLTLFCTNEDEKMDIAFCYQFITYYPVPHRVRFPPNRSSPCIEIFRDPGIVTGE